MKVMTSAVVDLIAKRNCVLHFLFYDQNQLELHEMFVFCVLVCFLKIQNTSIKSENDIFFKYHLINRKNMRLNL